MSLTALAYAVRTMEEEKMLLEGKLKVYGTYQKHLKYI